MDEAADLVAIADDLGEAGVRSVLHAAGARAALKAFNRDCAIRFAADLLSRRAGSDVIRDRLMARYGVSTATAYRYFAAAVSLSKAIRREKRGMHDQTSNMEV